ncbi:hypothetical protein C2E15_08975 [Mixta gaviniae]|uniref:Uncharacterized protein n=1 Tax=Mixta gaviniae TaxID=665914 RepID=A0A1X1DPR6_9GAMM|nr:hypothetical protein C2E15_08975 [Mixta gaviniae]ORM78630.1 hypothetical protein HA44_12670 [Mixta gaviniae]
MFIACARPPWKTLHAFALRHSFALTPDAATDNAALSVSFIVSPPGALCAAAAARRAIFPLRYTQPT